MQLDHRVFFDLVRTKLFGGRLTSGQVEGLTAILDGWSARAAQGGNDPLAYVLATAFHETAATMQPVRETLAASDRTAIARLEQAFAAGKLGSVRMPYWRPDENGRSWLGRGLVQLTHRRNYEAMSEITGIDLLTDPGRAMEMPVSVAILIEGMRRGSFTGRKLDDYFGPGRADWTGARKIINGNDRAELVARHARVFAQALDTRPH
ncbi:hypothetical protein J2X76_000429 [Neorhizobium sp. 2083]|uniref:hypothetical protein n=1 Tax=Neorhizobium sp. 2083 TaxID=2817762 RepID=UPI002864782B|nr:hypothetical protein [Neorhizobium sp. 2083]MDR6815275.1 hypothetical protein [Neorhizobium sp. 2083]